MSAYAQPVRTVRDLVALTDEQLIKVDPIEMNLVVAKEIPALAHLDIPRFQRMADKWAEDFKRSWPNAERQFRASPGEWRNDLAFFRVGFLCQFIEQNLGIAYREDQRNIRVVAYTDPSDLFLNGVMETRRGTCANLATLNVVLARRLGWPVSLACARAHLFSRFDDGRVTHNFETTQSGFGGFRSDPDDFLMRHHGVSPLGISCGSDLRALSPRQMLGVFVGLRGRYWRDIDRDDLSEPDFLLARYLFPQSRHLFNLQVETSVQRGRSLFEPHETGHPVELARWLQQVVLVDPWGRRNQTVAKETNDDSSSELRYTYEEFPSN